MWNLMTWPLTWEFPEENGPCGDSRNQGWSPSAHYTSAAAGGWHSSLPIDDGAAGKEFTCNARDTGDVSSTPGLGISPKKEMETHSSILAWEITWTGEPVGLQSSGLKRVGHDWSRCTRGDFLWDGESQLCLSTFPCFRGNISVSVVKTPPASLGDLDLIPGSGRSPGGETGTSL